MRAFIRKILKPNSKTAVLVFVIVAFALGYLLRGGGPERQPQSHQQAAPEEAKVDFWTCAMHPQIQLPKPGQCPICGMDLIPVSSGGGDDELGIREIKLSARAIKLAEVAVAPVERKMVTAEIRMVGKIDYDEQLVKYITAWVPGRIDRLYVDFTGVSVEKGDHMVYLYSPELLTAQEELLQSLKTVRKLKQSGLKSIRETALQTIDSSRERLRLWGLTKAQIKEIERRGKPDDHMTINAPMGGVVIHKDGFEGMYFDIGTRIYTIADLSHLWIMLDAYESDLVWIRYGQKVVIETEAYPGEVFNGRIAFIDPFLNAKTRTVKVRVNVPNPDGRLKPEMFVRAIVRAKVVGENKVIAPSLAGKWMCRMHPEIIKDSLGRCDICDMLLVRTDSLGYVSADVKKDEIPLVIPASAPLITGKRAVVYVELPGKEGIYEGREIVLGPRAGDYYLVREGLSEGELVVVNGNFKIDSAIQILAKPSMMSPEGGAPAPGHQHGGEQVKPPAKVKEKKLKPFNVSDAFKVQLDGVFSTYFAIHQALSQDDFKSAKESAKKLDEVIDTVEMKLLEETPHMTWMEEQKVLAKGAEEITGAKDIEGARSAFIQISDSLYTVAKRFGTSGAQPILRFHCSMAADGKGAYWLQNKPGTENPYYGDSAMFKCGDQVETISTGPIEVPDSFKSQMDGLFSAYFKIHQTLSQDDFIGSQNGAKVLREALDAVDMKLLTGSAHMAWMEEQKTLKKSNQEVTTAKDIENARLAFIQISDSLYTVAKRFGTSNTQPVFRFHCSMAAGGKGAYWLQNKPGTENPYYGDSAMFKCGDQVETIFPGPVEEQSGEHKHE